MFKIIKTNYESSIKLLADKISIKEIMLALNKKDVRAVLRWCKKQSLIVLKFGKEKYVNLIDFQLAVDQPFIESLQLKYPENWQALYTAYKEGDYVKIAELKTQKIQIAKSSYKPLGPAGKRFLEIIKHKLK